MVRGKPAGRARGITPWVRDEQELLYSLYKENKRNSEIARAINQTYWNGKSVRSPDSVHQFILFAIEKGWLKKTRVDETLWTKEELERVVVLAASAEELSKQEIADRLNQEFHQGKPIRMMRSIEYGLDLAFKKGYDPLMGVLEHGAKDL